MAITVEPTTLLIDEVLPEFGFTRIEHRMIDAPASVASDTIRTLDLMTVHSPITDLAMFVRSVPERINRALGRRVDDTPAPPTLRLSDLFDDTGTHGLEGWIPLGELPGREFVFGAVGKFWRADIEWKTIDPADFAGYSEPGWGRIAASISARQYGEGRSILTYEARTALTNDEARKLFGRYWSVVSPFVGTIMRAALRTVDERLENANDVSTAAW